MDVRIGQARQERATCAVDGGRVRGRAKGADGLDAPVLDEEVMAAFRLDTRGIDDGDVTDDDALELWVVHQSVWNTSSMSCHHSPSARAWSGCCRCSE